jgi:hypothetical protein
LHPNQAWHRNYPSDDVYVNYFFVNDVSPAGETLYSPLNVTLSEKDFFHEDQTNQLKEVLRGMILPLKTITGVLKQADIKKNYKTVWNQFASETQRYFQRKQNKSITLNIFSHSPRNLEAFFSHRILTNQDDVSEDDDDIMYDKDIE